MCMCSPTKHITTSRMCGMIWTPYDWLNKFYSFYMATIVVIGGGYSLRIKACCRNQPNKSTLLLYK